MAIAEKKDLFTFPPAPDATTPEWPGTPIGAKNTITRTKGRTAVANKTVDATPGLFKRLLANAFQHVATSGQTTYSHDVVIHGLRVRFEHGRAIDIDADRGAETIRGFAARDENACRLGEVSLVDRESRIGALETLFYDTLIDENAASHIAIGDAYKSTVDEPDYGRINRSEIHLDFMIGGAGVDVHGVTQDGERVPVLRDGVWAV